MTNICHTVTVMLPGMACWLSVVCQVQTQMSDLSGCFLVASGIWTFITTAVMRCDEVTMSSWLCIKMSMWIGLCWDYRTVNCRPFSPQCITFVTTSRRTIEDHDIRYFGQSRCAVVMQRYIVQTIYRVDIGHIISYRYRQEKYRNFDISLSFQYGVDVVYFLILYSPDWAATTATFSLSMSPRLAT